MPTRSSPPDTRSVDKLGELAWLLGRDDIVAAMDHAGYPMYGAPKVKAFADGFGWPFLDDLDGDEAGPGPDGRGTAVRPAGLRTGLRRLTTTAPPASLPALTVHT
ncbi:hypothetical protein [Micromonospora sp. C95]|uniref:hypothetical protein n=1 Tax=Micromonospora sp. C95 TaxID=2824882 RepID=UPI0026573D56|nr:hypothetical protein [Micromonospora sp. C95]